MHRPASICALTLLLAACGAAPSGEAPDAAPAAAPAGEDAAADGQAAFGVDIDALAIDYAGQATQWLQANAVAVPAALGEATETMVQAEAAEEDCSRHGEADRLFAADIDGDGTPEGLATYTLEGCGGGGNNYHRNLVVLREGDAGWQAVLSTPLSAKLSGNRVVDRIEAGQLTLSPSGPDDPFSSDAGPETIQVPPAGS